MKVRHIVQCRKANRHVQNMIWISTWCVENFFAFITLPELMARFLGESS